MNEEMESINIEELVEGSSLFESRGVSTLKVTKNGIVKSINIPIRSSGISELIDEVRKQSPLPPVKNELVKPDSDMGKAMKLQTKKWVQIFDATDPDYIAEKEKYDSDLGLKIVLKGIDASIKDKEGNVVEDEDRKIEILKSMGITGEHFTQLIRDISALTKWEDAKEDDFLP